MVCQEAGLSFQDDGLYFIDYGWEWKVADWAEIEGEFEDWEETDDE